MTRRMLLGALIAGCVVLAPAAKASPDSDADTRRGAIVSGVFTGSWAWPCADTPDCRAWRQTGCDPALANHNPAWLTSIVDVADLADGATPRRFEFWETELGGPVGPAGIILGGVRVEFWRVDCTSTGPAWSSMHLSPLWAVLGYNQEITSFIIPADAKWMTIVGNDNFNIGWELGWRP